MAVQIGLMFPLLLGPYPLRTGDRAMNPELSKTEQLVRLQAEPPLRVHETILNGALRVGDEVRPIHGLQEEVREIERLESLRQRRGLRKHELELIAAREHERRHGLWTHTDPIQAARRRLRAVRLDGNFEPALVKRLDRRLVELQQRLAAGAHNQWPGVLGTRPRPP